MGQITRRMVYIARTLGRTSSEPFSCSQCKRAVSCIVRRVNTSPMHDNGWCIRSEDTLLVYCTSVFCICLQPKPRRRWLQGRRAPMRCRNISLSIWGHGFLNRRHYFVWSCRIEPRVCSNSLILNSTTTSISNVRVHSFRKILCWCTKHARRRGFFLFHGKLSLKLET